MKDIIIRKPKFMRNDAAMAVHLKVAAIISEEAARPDTSLEQQVNLLGMAGKCLNDAAKAGGFFSTKDFIKWMDRQKHTI